MDVVVCPACGASSHASENRRVRYHGNGTFNGEAPDHIRLCAACGFGIAEPEPSDDALRAYYGGSLYWAHDDDAVADPRENAAQAALAFARWQFLEDALVKNGRTERLAVLDVGAGNGFIACAANGSRRARVASYVAVEPDPRVGAALQAASPRLAPAINCSVVRDLASAPHGVDLVVASQVLEHVTDPRSFLHDMAAHVRPGGFLFIDVPHLDYRFKSDVFPHLGFFSPQSLRRLAGSCGLEVVSLAVCGRSWNGAVAGAGGWVGSLIRRIVNRLRRVLPTRSLLSFYDWDLGASRLSDDGPWIRLLARKAQRA
jgi:SAM-dependent methyltransferase